MNMGGEELVNYLISVLQGKDIIQKINYLTKNYCDKVIFTTSFGYEDQVITDMIFKNDLPVQVITLDTGRLFEETYKVWRSTVERYGKAVEVFFPPGDKVEKMLIEKGPFSFYESIENRKECCYIRKVIPLKRALKDNVIWITGLRTAQSENRSSLYEFEWDRNNDIVKYNPLLEWKLDDVKQYVRQHNVPYNILHDKGFVSIGCEPCTRAVKPGEDFRAGRWWWEQSSGKECGLHE